MLIMGGPSMVHDSSLYLKTYDFLGLSMDDDLIPLHFQRIITPLIAKWRTPQVEKQYADIQCELLDELHPETAPHEPYVLSRCANPPTQETVQKMKAGVKRAGEMGDIKWSVIDRWGMHPGFIKAVARNIEAALAKFQPSARSNVIILFSAHSLPMLVVNRGGTYVLKVFASDNAVMDRFGHSNPYFGPFAWIEMQTGEATKGLTRLGIEMLYELDLEYMKEVNDLAMELDRAESSRSFK
ncbi:ferrochelatase [Suillus variegatus]|nr:ferrochelatase [Suillus variegatus]